MGEKEPEKQEGEKKSGDGGAGAAPAAAAAAGGGGPVTVVLKVDLHCEGCAQKVKKNLKHLKGVETVKADYTSSKVTVVGKVDPAVVREKVEEKTKKKVELVSPLPPKKDKAEGGGSGGDAKKPDEKAEKKPDDTKKAEEKKPKEPPPVVTVVVKTRVHCDGCAYKMKKIISKYEGVQDVNVDLAKDQITIKGTMDMKEMLPYLNTKLKRPVDIVPPPAKKDDGDKKPKEGGDAGGDKTGKETVAAKPAADAGGGDKKADAKPAAEESAAAKVEIVNKMEHYGYPYGYEAHTYNPQVALENGYVAEYMHAPQPYMHAPQPYMHEPQPYMHAPHQYMHAPQYMHGQYGAGPSHAQPPPPQMFSDENPNACSIM